MSAACARPLAEETLLGYWQGELPDQEAQAAEEHLFGCDACGVALGRIADLAAAVGDAVRRGAVNAVLSPALLESLKRSGLRLREYRLLPGESLPCTVAAEDELVLARLTGDFAGAARLDIVFRDTRGVSDKAEDVPFDPAGKEIVFARSAALLRTLPELELKISVLDVRPDGARPLAEYTLRHSPAGD